MQDYSQDGLNTAKYPTSEQIEDCFNAWKAGGKDGLLRYLRQRQQAKRDRELSEEATDREAGQM